MATKGPFSSQSEPEQNLRDYFAGEMLNIINANMKRHNLDVNALIPTHVASIRSQADNMIEQLKSIGRKRLQREPMSSELVDFFDLSIGKWRHALEIQPKSGQFKQGLQGLPHVFETSVNEAINQMGTRINDIETAKKELQTYGGDISDSLRRRMFRGQIEKEDFDRAVQIEKKAIAEGKVREELAGLPAQEEKALSEFEKALSSQQQQFFEQDIVPTIISQLNTRGLLDSGSLSTALAKAGGRLQREVRGTIAPLRAQVGLGAPTRAFEQTLRGALESGQSLSDATAFARQMLGVQRGQAFEAAQAGLGREFQNEQFRQTAALQLALRPKGPSALDQFLQYGLPVAGQLASSAILAGKGQGQTTL